MPRRPVTVFEAANEQLKEVYLTWTILPIFDAMSELSKRLPRAISHWKPKSQQITFRSLEFELTEDGARAFIARRLSKGLEPGWRYISEIPESGSSR